MIFYTAENYIKEIHKVERTHHGMYKSIEYRTWGHVRRRCLNKKQTGFHHYGGRGIGICEKWLSFINFYQDMGSQPIGTQIDRIDNDLGYFKENCRWASRSSNAANKRKYRNLNLPTGVFKFRNKFRSCISVNNKQCWIGSFETIEDARAAYEAIYKEWHGFMPPK